jgi:hypothetical protein
MTIHTCGGAAEGVITASANICTVRAISARNIKTARIVSMEISNSKGNFSKKY